VSKQCNFFRRKKGIKERLVSFIPFWIATI
jgi:hypothetical protein